MTERLKVLLDMRPSLDGHSGIPQEARLLFRGLSGLDSVDALGLIQSGNLPLDAGLPLQQLLSCHQRCLGNTDVLVPRIGFTQKTIYHVTSRGKTMLLQRRQGVCEIV